MLAATDGKQEESLDIDPFNKRIPLICPLCGCSEFREVYKMSGYAIRMCRSCRTGSSLPMPLNEDLAKYYDGFHGNITVESVQEKIPAAGLFFEKMGLPRGKNLRLLDVGGGNGLFAKAFEECGYGRSTYVDVDSRSCDFVENSLSLRDVFNVSIEDITGTLSGKFDIIYSRHLIEHLANPMELVSSLLGMRKEGGKVIVQCPNGDSMEYLAYYYSSIRDRYHKIRLETGFGKWRVLWMWLRTGMLHDIDPPRHLWAISRRGMRAWADGNGFPMRMFTANLGDIAFSPFYRPRSRVCEMMADGFGRTVLSRIHGGAHLVAVFE